MHTTNRNWKVESISHLAFNPTDMDKTLKFYCDGFGFKKKALLTYADYEKTISENRELYVAAKTLGEKTGEIIDGMIRKFSAIRDMPWVVYLEIVPGQLLEFFYPMGNFVMLEPLRELGKERVGYSHLSLQVDNIKEAVEDLKNKGIMPTSNITLGPDFTYQCWFADPDGNRIELMEYTDKSLQIVGRKFD